MQIDLHAHSTASDGTQTPEGVMESAARAGLDVVALTDHDTVLGWEEAADAVDPDAGYVVAWTSSEVGRRLAGDGHDVVAAPAQRYYLDMAASADWHEPGAGWAGFAGVVVTAGLSWCSA